MLLRDLLNTVDYDEQINLWTRKGDLIESGIAQNDNIWGYGGYTVYKVSGAGAITLDVTINMR